MIVIVSAPSPDTLAVGMLVYFALSLFCTFLCAAHRNRSYS